MTPLAPARHAALAAPNPTRLAALLEATAPPAAAERAVGEDRMLPVPDALAHLVPGLPRGQAAEVADIGLLLRLAGAAVRDPERIPDRTGWVAVVGAPWLGLLAATEAGVDPDRLLTVDHPGDRYPDVIAALAPAVDVLILAGAQVSDSTARRLGAILAAAAPPCSPPTLGPARRCA